MVSEVVVSEVAEGEAPFFELPHFAEMTPERVFGLTVGRPQEEGGMRDQVYVRPSEGDDGGSYFNISLHLSHAEDGGRAGRAPTVFTIGWCPRENRMKVYHLRALYFRNGDDMREKYSEELPDEFDRSLFGTSHLFIGRKSSQQDAEGNHFRLVAGSYLKSCINYDSKDYLPRLDGIVQQIVQGLFTNNPESVFALHGEEQGLWASHASRENWLTLIRNINRAPQIQLPLAQAGARLPLPPRVARRADHDAAAARVAAEARRRAVAAEAAAAAPVPRAAAPAVVVQPLRPPPPAERGQMRALQASFLDPDTSRPFSDVSCILAGSEAGTDILRLIRGGDAVSAEYDALLLGYIRGNEAFTRYIDTEQQKSDMLGQGYGDQASILARGQHVSGLKRWWKIIHGRE